MVADEVAFLTAKAAALLAEYDSAPPPEGPPYRTFEDVERFWAEEVAPVMASLKSMSGYHAITDEVAAIPDDSVWRASATGPLQGLGSDGKLRPPVVLVLHRHLVRHRHGRVHMEELPRAVLPDEDGGHAEMEDGAVRAR